MVLNTRKDSNMEIRVYQSKNWQGCLCEELWIGNKLVCYVYPLTESPEDATIERDLVSPSEIAEWLQQAWEAGKNGEGFGISIEQEEE